jgi:hypothetical protein
MKEQFVDHEIAALLKEKGFKEECMAFYEISIKAKEDPYDGFSGPFGWKKGEVNFNKGYFENSGLPDNSNEYWLLCGAPLWQQAIDWLRDVKKVEIIVESGHVDLGYSYHIYYTKDGKSRRMDGFGHDELEEVEYDYPEAREKAIKHALTLI